LVRATPPESLIRNAIFDRDPAKKWSEGSVLLLGDAIHPITPNLGQGGCLAIEDAAILARCISKYGLAQSHTTGSLDIALRNFKRLRYARTATVARCSRMYGVVGQWRNPLVVGLRRVALTLVPALLTQRLLRWLSDYDAYAVNV